MADMRHDYEESLFERYERGEELGNLLSEAGQEVERLRDLVAAFRGRRAITAADLAAADEILDA